MIKLDHKKLGDLLKTLKQKRRELDNQGGNLTMPVLIDIDDLILLLEHFEAEI